MSTAARRKQLREYMLLVRDLLRLSEWDIEISDKPCESDDSSLEILPQFKRHYASVRVGAFFNDDQDREEQRQTVAHELLHLCGARLWDWLQAGIIDEYFPHHEAFRTKRLLIDEIEQVTDFAARMIAPHLPYPPEWD